MTSLAIGIPVMGNWLQKALGRADSSSERPVPVPFEMVCLCGHALTGTRQDRARRVICSECGRAQFILPLNRYPVSEWKYFGGQQTEEPLDPTDEMPSFEGGASARESSGEIRKPLVAPKKPARRTSDDDQIRVVDDDLEPVARPTPSRRRAERLDRIEMAPRERTSSRGKVFLLLGLLSVVVVSSVTWMIFKHRRETAELQFKRASDAGHLAFENADFGKARSEFDDALQAARVLGLNETQREAIETRRAHADAILKLADLELFDLLTVPSADVAGKSVIVQTSVVSHAMQVEKQSFVEWDLLGAKVPVRLRGLDALDEVVKKSGLTEVLLAAELERIESVDGGAAVVVQFRKGTAFLWQDVESLKRLGLCLPSDEEATHAYRQLCSRQAAAVRGETVPPVTQVGEQPKVVTP